MTARNAEQAGIDLGHNQKASAGSKVYTTEPKNSASFVADDDLDIDVYADLKRSQESTVSTLVNSGTHTSRAQVDECFIHPDRRALVPHNTSYQVAMDAKHYRPNNKENERHQGPEFYGGSGGRDIPDRSAFHEERHNHISAQQTPQNKPNILPPPLLRIKGRHLRDCSPVGSQNETPESYDRRSTGSNDRERDYGSRNIKTGDPRSDERSGGYERVGNQKQKIFRIRGQSKMMSNSHSRQHRGSSTPRDGYSPAATPRSRTELFPDWLKRKTQRSASPPRFRRRYDSPEKSLRLDAGGGGNDRVNDGSSHYRDSSRSIRHREDDSRSEVQYRDRDHELERRSSYSSNLNSYHRSRDRRSRSPDRGNRRSERSRSPVGGGEYLTRGSRYRPRRGTSRDRSERR